VRNPHFKLFQPGRIGSLEIKNRMIMAPMSTRLAEDGCVTERMLAYYGERAKGGVGAIVVEAAIPRSGGYIPSRLGIGDEKYIPGLKRLVTVIHQNGAKAILQLNPHRGREDDLNPLSPSVAQHPWKKGIVAKAATREDLLRVVEDFGEGARRTREAGFDGLMVHLGHGYLACEFLSPLVNERTDQYGGSLEKRARLGLELVGAAKGKAGHDYPLVVRLSASERRDGGFSVAEAISVCKMLEDSGVGAIDVVSGFMDTYYWSMPCTRLPRGCNVELAAAIKRKVGIPVGVAGRINGPDVAAEILNGGQADFISLGRALLADPEFPKKTMEGRQNEIRQCIACMECMNPVHREEKPYVRCAINPEVGEEIAYPVEATGNKKRVLVIGGGPAGMEVAFVAASRGHWVTLWEKSERLGGQLKTAVRLPYKQELSNLLAYFESELERLGVQVELGKDFDSDSITRSKADVLVLATGSSPFSPDIPGLYKRKAIMASGVLNGEEEAGRKVIVLGGGLLGCETAEFLADQGKRVVIVEILDEVARDASLFVRWPLLESLKNKKVEIMTGVKDEEVIDEGLKLTDKEGRRVLVEAETIVVAAGAKPERSSYEALTDRFARIYSVGDCVQPGKIWDAIHAGAAMGRRI
jgi:2,4-dienoyl-CoA reductase-like NADH-dependent reductase (Old Yellow Enzyme family)/thioredoxin reductase